MIFNQKPQLWFKTKLHDVVLGPRFQQKKKATQ